FIQDTLKHSVKGFSRTALSELQEIGFSQATVRIWAFQQRRSGACSKTLAIFENSKRSSTHRQEKPFD
ncbi:hypothetical protein ACY0LY_005255, partial [Klebsiella pneumoniae]|uniref:hypothetical protein n=2 Tax=Klebsiella pneumoniae TaxID=573 RepID=UPI0025564F7A